MLRYLTINFIFCFYETALHIFYDNPFTNPLQGPKGTWQWNCLLSTMQGVDFRLQVSLRIRS
jgi:hypothetical protein